jgi:HlyD family secretion protein
MSHRPRGTRARRSTGRVHGLVVLALLAVSIPACRNDGVVPAVGTVERDRLELVAEAQEPIVEIPVREGERVAAGQVVLRLEEKRLAADVERAKGARDRAMARLAELERGPRRERIEEARARLEGAEGVLVTARRDLERFRKLAAEDIAEQARLDQARASYDEALSRRNQAKAELDALVTGTTPEELDQARAAVAEAQGALQAARIRQERLVVRAPQDGIIDALPFELGERPPPGAVVAVMLSDGVPYARVYVPESIRAHVRPGMKASVRVDGVEGDFEGRVRTVSHEATFTPFFALTEKDRGRLVYLAEVDLLGPRARELPTGVPVEARFDVGPESDGDE